MPIIKGERELIRSFGYTSQRDGISSFLKDYGDLICNNPDITVQLEWSLDKKQITNYQSVNEARKYIENLIFANCGHQVSVPLIFKEAQEGLQEIGLSISAEKLIYSPIQHALTAKDFTIPQGSEKNKINTVINLPDQVSFHKMFVLNLDGMDTIRDLSSGTGSPPKGINWDWKDNGGNLLDPQGRYIIGLLLVNKTEKVIAFCLIPFVFQQQNLCRR
jgi:hypothetical protein